jgi:ADP-ribose pyrophosphatase YjhB (NUDIX family)
MEFREYAVEDGKNVDIKRLQTGFVEPSLFSEIHKNTALLTVDVLIKYQGGWLLVHRDNVPAKGEYFPVGGRVKKGIPILEAIKNKAREECGLALEQIRCIGVSRQMFQTDPFGHEKGTDTTSIMFIAIGSGNITLDKHHDNYLLVDEDKFEEIKDNLHPYVRDFLITALNS